MGRKNKKNNYNNQSYSNQPQALQQHSYRLGEYIGTESRSRELKAGSGFIQHDFREKIAKYVCGWANSGENGTLMLGIDDKGIVVGYGVTHNEEDRLRLQIDEGVKDVQPMIHPRDYAVQFVPIVDEYDNQINSHHGGLKVIELSVVGSNLGNQDQLYGTKQGVFVRRDGSLQELKAHDIQHWVKQKYQTENDKLKKNEENMRREFEQQASVIRNQSDKILKQQEEINTLKQQSDQQRAESSNQTANELTEIREMLARQEADRKKQEQLAQQEPARKNEKSKVCVVS